MARAMRELMRFAVLLAIAILSVALALTKILQQRSGMIIQSESFSSLIRRLFFIIFGIGGDQEAFASGSTVEDQTIYHVAHTLLGAFLVCFLSHCWITHINQVVVVVLLLNLLIAAFNNIYMEVQANVRREWLFLRAQQLHVYESSPGLLR
jgi:hypothetical protein